MGVGLLRLSTLGGGACSHKRRRKAVHRLHVLLVESNVVLADDADTRGGPYFPTLPDDLDTGMCVYKTTSYERAAGMVARPPV